MKLKNLNRPITRSEIESVIKKELPTNKSPESGSQANSIKHTRKNLY